MASLKNGSERRLKRKTCQEFSGISNRPFHPIFTPPLTDFGLWTLALSGRLSQKDTMGVWYVSPNLAPAKAKGNACSARVTEPSPKSKVEP